MLATDHSKQDTQLVSGIREAERTNVLGMQILIIVKAYLFHEGQERIFWSQFRNIFIYIYSLILLYCTLLILRYLIIYKGF